MKACGIEDSETHFSFPVHLWTDCVSEVLTLSNLLDYGKGKGKRGKKMKGEEDKGIGRKILCS